MRNNDAGVMPEYCVVQGDCISSIAERYGFFWETVWNHPNNAGLKSQRLNPNVLLPGDVVFIPEKQPKAYDKPTDGKHRFVRKGVPASVRVRLLDFERRPRTGLRFCAVVDGRSSEGESDSDGYITITVPPDAQEVRLTVQEGVKTEEYVLPLGHVDPIDSFNGLKQRLTNLGYACGPGDSTLDEQTQATIRAFQREMKLQETGEVDDQTRERLKELHGC
jgi:hypothetical protein